jgi:hypothetical protein
MCPERFAFMSNVGFSVVEGMWNVKRTDAARKEQRMGGGRFCSSVSYPSVSALWRRRRPGFSRFEELCYRVLDSVSSVFTKQCGEVTSAVFVL